MNRRDLIKWGLALGAWLAGPKGASATTSSGAGAAAAPKRAVGRQTASRSQSSAPEFDAEYIVVGSGAGGGTVAARLAE